MTPQASIVVTAFDRDDSLIRLLTGLNNQSLGPECYEVILADDSGDTRLGERVAANLQTSYALTVVRTELPYGVNGVSVARNLGIQKARADIVISIDDDCFPGFFFVEEHLAAHQRPYPAIVLGHRSNDPSKLKEDRPISVNEPKSTNELLGHTAGLLDYTNFMTGNISLPRQMAIDCGLFNEIFAQPGEHGYEDIEMGYRLWRQGIPTHFSRNAMIYRPATEPEKEQQRLASNAMVKASHRLLKLHPLVPVVRQFLIAIHERREDEAIDTGARILSQDPENWPVQLNYGELLLTLGRLEEAEKHMRQALQLYDQNPAVHLKLAECMFRQKRFDEALEFTLKTLELNPDQTRALYLMAQLGSRPSPANTHSPVTSFEINIELGGGASPTKIRGEGHDNYINLDAINSPAVDVATDFYRDLPLPDGAINRVFSREMIEHLPYRRLPEFINECYRVMAPSGKGRSR